MTHRRVRPVDRRVPPDAQVAMTRARGIWLCSFVFLAGKGGDKSILTLRHLTGANSFTVFGNNFLFVNSGPPITNGHGILLCSPPKSFQ